MHPPYVCWNNGRRNNFEKLSFSSAATKDGKLFSFVLSKCLLLYEKSIKELMFL